VIGASGNWRCGLRFKVFGQGHSAGDKQVGVFKQDDEVMALRGVCLMLRADGGYCSPSLLDGAADAVLVALGQTVPKRHRVGQTLAGHSHWLTASHPWQRWGCCHGWGTPHRRTASHPFARSAANGWGTRALS